MPLMESPIKTETIRDRVFQELRNISHDSLGDGDARQVEHANALREAWEFHEALMKEQGREVQEKEMEYFAQIEDLSGQNLATSNLRSRIFVQGSTRYQERQRLQLNLATRLCHQALSKQSERV